MIAACNSSKRRTYCSPLLSSDLLLIPAAGTGQLLGFTTRKDKLIRPDKNGKIMILDVSSLHPQSSDDAIPFGYVDWCAEACNRVPDCNAFAFCNDPKGCGTDCARYTADHPQSE